ncbi:daunorubicin resistance protein DrrA family ABC transporter ATP-binding protein [Amycolatopsis benzoatilytica]|uniref:daunorubicin resistance protein DrrA family ABC transporter ATP-binding protein n=1 Tax=Amycolatopsis benzoatilytica TaxID=346045 RepID=UPI000361CFCC|nr:daunorubicin resistance protein DrrA family ABC transporter ATP-binding protein [Amycolatopsis benzoatilytica]
MTEQYAVEARGIVKNFGTHRALDGVDLLVPKGSVLGLLGPNGAGKTTMVRVLTTLLDPDEGEATVAGHDLRTDPGEVRRSIGLSGQYAAVDEALTGYENLYLVGRLYGLGRKGSAARARELLGRFRLTDAAERPAKTYSGGMRRRLDLAGALVASPSLVVLDEPTTGLDPRSRMDTWDLVRELVSDGTSVLLTTQYLEEADQLADSITVLDRGRIIEQGTADELKARVGSERLEFVVATAAELPALREVLAEVGAAEPVVENHLRRGHVLVHAGTKTVVEALQRLEDRGVRVLDVSLHRPRLDDVFLTLTETSADGAAE